jgi:hypothetical protein
MKTDGKIQEIQVTLFGQPCTMSGPFPKTALTIFHEISPEKIPPSLTVAQMKQLRAKANENKGLPQPLPFPLEQYRDHLRKRLSAKISFEEAVAHAKKSKSKDSKKELSDLLKNLKEHISTLQFPSFAETTKQSFIANGSKWDEAFLIPLQERYEALIQPDTEEEFHKAIRLAKIQYVCVFDDGDHKSDEAEATE